MAKAALLVTRVLALALLAPAAALAQRAQAELACAPTKTDFIYDCTIRLTRGGQPRPGAQITVGADMPSMPMAHNVKPVKARPGKAPGEYAASLDLEMLGEWAVKLRLAGPVKDQLVLLYDFDEKGARPVTRSGKPHRK
jgi:hypothetical protein